MAATKRPNLHAEVLQNLGSMPMCETPYYLSQRRFSCQNPHQSELGGIGPYPPHSLRIVRWQPRDVSKDLHVAENIGTTRSCYVCAKNRIRTQGGGHVYSRYKCQKCDVVLCRGIRNCFLQYHEELGIPVD